MVARPPPEDCTGFPTRAVDGDRIWRATKDHRKERPWWFASLPLDTGDDDKGGRFDLPQPRGTSYWASERLAAAAEVLLPDADSGTLPLSVLGNRVVVSARAPMVAVADLTDAGAAAYGITNELSTGPRPYDLSQAWARALDLVSDGVYYPTRHHTSGRSYGFFGEGGQDSDAPDTITPLLAIQEEIEDGLRLRFLDPPALAELEPLGDSGRMSE